MRLQGIRKKDLEPVFKNEEMIIKGADQITLMHFGSLETLSQQDSISSFGPEQSEE